MTPLELLASSNDCFISDLRYRPPEELDFTALLAADSQQVEEWRMVQVYIFPQAPSFDTVEEIKEYLRSQKEGSLHG